MRQRQRGFTLVEVMIAVVIIAIIAAIALPSYQNQVFRSRRADGREMLQRIVSAQERFYTNRNTYTADLTTAAGLNMPSANSEAGHYVIRIVVPANGQSYTLTAAPQGVQAPDACANLTVNNVGARGYTGNESNGRCW